METTGRIVIDDGTMEQEFACALCGEYLVDPNDDTCYHCDAFIHPEIKDVIVSPEKFEADFGMPY